MRIVDHNDDLVRHGRVYVNGVRLHYMTAGGEALDWFGDPIDLGHSTPWSAADLRSAGLPYVAQLGVQEVEDWNGYPAFRPMGGDKDGDFEVWCAYLARSVAGEHADSPDLLGYFLVDIPAWLPHASGADFPELRGLDPAGRDKKLYDVASRYYQTIVTAIRRYVPDHLVLGDRYNGNKGIPEPVLRHGAVRRRVVGAVLQRPDARGSDP